MRVSSVLTPRRAPAGFGDIAEKRPLMSRQRVARYRVRRRVARTARYAVQALTWMSAATLLLVAGLLASRWVTTSPRFALTQVEVQGHSRLTPKEVQEASGLRLGTNLFAVDGARAVAAIEALPQVRRAELVRQVPGRVTLMVEERRPFGLVHAGQLHWVDEHGVAVGREPRAVVPPGPVLSGLGPAELGAGGRPPSERLLLGLALLRALTRSGTPLLAQISEIDVGRPEGPVLYTVEGIEVRIGREDWESKLARLSGVLAQLRSSGPHAAGIDLRFRDQVVLRPALR